MGKKALGIEIGDAHITGVVLDQSGKSAIVTACLCLPLADHLDVAQQACLLCEQLDWKEGACVFGLPLSLLSVRNLTLPFQDKKKIAQALPFEIEEQLIVPVDTLVTDFLVSETTDLGSSIVAFAADKTFLGELLEGLQGVIDPDILVPGSVALAAQVVSQNREGKTLLLSSTDQHSITIVLIQGAHPLFYRRISYPEQMILQPPFLFENGQVVATDMAAIEQFVRIISGSIERSLDYFHLEKASDRRPEKVLLTGCLAELDDMAEKMALALNLPVEKLDLHSAGIIDCSEAVCPQWKSHRFDQAASLALLGFGPKAAVNFRGNSFTKKRVVFSTRKQMMGTITAMAVLAVCFLGFMWNNYRLLQHRDKAAREEMSAIYKQTFPKITKVHEPYAEMKAALKTVQGPEAPTPLFATDKRVLSLLADISARIPAAVVVQVNRLAIDRESILVKGTTDTYNSVDTIKNALSVSPRYKGVQIVSATADKEKKSGIVRFEIQLQLGGS